MDASIKRLDNETSWAMQATVRVASLHSAVEEVILNSLAAGCQRVDILVDFESHGFEVIDDGVGISFTTLRDVVGTWPSAEAWAGSAGQWRSKTLLALRQLGSVHITTKCSWSNLVSYKHMSRNEEAVVKVSSEKSLHSENSVARRMADRVLRSEHGTIVRVEGLFDQLPVRRRAARLEAEVAALRSFVRHLSVLHHAVSWTLSLGALTQMQATPRPAPVSTQVLALSGQSAVAKRVLQLHGADCVQSMQEVSCAHDQYTLVGLLSPPRPECCSDRADCQYAFLDGRWLRGCDLLSKELNDAYEALLAGPAGAHGGSRGGMVARHALDNSGAASVRRVLPRFVLHVSSGTTQCEVLDEPGKAVVVVLTNEEGFRTAVRKLVQEMYDGSSLPVQHTGPAIQVPAEREPMEDAAQTSEDVAHYQLADAERDAVDSQLSTDHVRMTAQSPPSLFRSAFFSGPSTPKAAEARILPSVPASPLGGRCWADSPYRGALSPDWTGACPGSCPAMSAEDMVVSAVLPREDVKNWPAWKRQRLEFDAEVRSPLQATCSDPHDIVPLSQDSQTIAPLPLLGDAFLPAPQDSEPCGASEESGTLGTTPSANDRAEDGLTRHLMQGLIARSAVGRQLDEAAGNIPDEAVRIAAAPAGTLQSLSISKSRLSEHLRCFGQLQKQFILASTCCCNARPGNFDNGTPCAACGDASLLLLFDQHAVDERIRVEELTRQLERDLSEGRVLRCCAQAERSTLHVAEGEACTLLDRSGAFFRWQFDFRVQDIRATGAEVTLRSVPVILGEALSAADFLEFVRLVATRGPTAPEGLLVPPAVQRILSSVACRGAVKFGDPLSQELCAGLLDRLLRDTELPFQCAHGRPTVGTLLRMDSARAWKMRALAAASL